MTDRRSLLIAGGTAALAAAAAGPTAGPGEFCGSVGHEAGAIPEGQLEVRLEDPALQGEARILAATRLVSDGRQARLGFALTPPANLAARRLTLVARLERADGWLLARGSAPFEPGQPIALTLNAVIY